MRKIILLPILLIISMVLSFAQTTVWEYSQSLANYPPYLTTDHTQRGIAYGYFGGQEAVFVVSRAGGNWVFAVNAATGNIFDTLRTAGVSGGTYSLNDIDVDGDSNIFLCNLAVNPSTNIFKVYRYDAVNDTFKLVINFKQSMKRLGDKFTVTGKASDNSLTIWALGASSDSLYKFTTSDNGWTFTNQRIWLNNGTTGETVGNTPSICFNNDLSQFFVKGNGIGVKRFQADGTLIDVLSTGIVGSGSNAIRYYETSGRKYIATFVYGLGNENAWIVDITEGLANGRLASKTHSMNGGTHTNTNGVGDVAIRKNSDGTYRLFVLATNNGIGAYDCGFIKAPYVGNYYIPKGSNAKGFDNLKAGVDSINVHGVTGTVNLLLDADTLRESSFTFNADLSVTNNVVVKPNTGKDVVLIVTPGASMGNGAQMIGFNKGFVTFDGSNDGSNSRNLIITTETNDARVPFGLNTANADTVILKNLIIKNLDNVTLNFRYGAVINDVDGVEGFQVENCQIGSPDRPVRRDGLAPWGSAGTLPTQFSFKDNEIYAGVRGITTFYLKNSEIIGNTINLIPTGQTGGTDAYNHGIYITGAQGEINITDNIINCLSPTTVTTSYLIGIAFAGNGTEVTDVINVFNNMINVSAATETRPVYGIGLRSANAMGNLKIYHNTIQINDNSSGLVSYGIGNHTNGTGSVNIDLKNNIIINNHTSNDLSAAIGLIPVTTVLNSNYNVLLSDSILVNFQGTTYTDLASWQTASGQDLNSRSKNVEFVSATDLHLTGASDGDVELGGIPLAEVTTDIDGDTRSTSAPYMGADEASTPLTPLWTIAAAKYDGDGDFYPDLLNDTVTVRGVVTTPNFTTNGFYFIQDETGGIPLYCNSALKNGALNLGDYVEVTGKLIQYKGLAEIQPPHIDGVTDTVIVLSTGNALPAPDTITIAQLKGNGEYYEGRLITIENLVSLPGQTWPNAGSNATIKYTDGTDTLDVFIDKETDVDGAGFPLEPTTITGVGSQYTSKVPADNGYQLMPRFLTDFEWIVPEPDTLYTKWEMVAGGLYPFLSTTDNGCRGLAYNPVTNHLIAVSRTSGNNAYVIDANNGELLKTLNMTGVDWQGTYAVNNISIAEDGAIYICNMFYGDPPSVPAIIYKWADEDATPKRVFRGNLEKRFGDVIKVVGSGNNTLIYLSGSQSCDRIWVFNTTDGDTFNVFKTIPVSITGEPQGYARGGIAPESADTNANVWIKGGGTPLQKLGPDGTVLATVDVSLVAGGYWTIDFLKTSTNKKLLAVGVGSGAGYLTNRIFDVTASDVPVPLYVGTFSHTYINNGNGTGRVQLHEDNTGAINLYVLNTNNAIGKFSTDTTYVEPWNGTEIKESNLLPTEYALLQNYPNPFNPTTTINFDLRINGKVSLKIYNVLGQEVATLVDRDMNAGTHKVNFDASNLASGVYIYRIYVKGIDGSEFIKAQKMMLLK